MSYWCNIIRHISTYVHTHRWKDSLFENAFVCVMVFLFEIQKTSVLFKAFFCSDSAIFFPFVWNFWKHFFDIWSWQNTCVRIEYSKASTILESNWLQFFCITECSKFQITYQCTQKKWHAHKAFMNAMDNILVMAINRRRKKNSKQLKEIVKVGKLITLIDRQQCSGIHTKIWIFVTPSKMQPSRTIDCHFILCSYISFFIVHLILFHFFAGKLLSSWAFKFVVDVKHKKKKTVVVFRGFFLHFFFCICIRI